MNNRVDGLAAVEHTAKAEVLRAGFERLRLRRRRFVRVANHSGDICRAGHGADCETDRDNLKNKKQRTSQGSGRSQV